MIEVHDLTKRFRDLVAVDAASFSARNGAITGLLGITGPASRRHCAFFTASSKPIPAARALPASMSWQCH